MIQSLLPDGTLNIKWFRNCQAHKIATLFELKVETIYFYPGILTKQYCLCHLILPATLKFEQLAVLYFFLLEEPKHLQKRIQVMDERFQGFRFFTRLLVRAPQLS